MKRKSRHFVTRDNHSTDIKIWNAQYGKPKMNDDGVFQQFCLGTQQRFLLVLSAQQWMQLSQHDCPYENECKQISIEYLA